MDMIQTVTYTSERDSSDRTSRQVPERHRKCRRERVREREASGDGRTRLSDSAIGPDKTAQSLEVLLLLMMMITMMIIAIIMKM
jgi:hypothetical protein